MSGLNLVSHHLCPYVQRAVIVLLEKNIPHRRTYIDLSNKPDWFVRLSPLGRVPMLVVDDAPLFESQVIAEYLDEVTPNSLHPNNPLEKAKHRSWIEFGSETLNAIGRFYSAPDAASFALARTDLRRRFERIQSEVHGPFFAGEQFHLVDGVWGTIFRYFDVFDAIENFDMLDGLQNIASWRRAVAHRRSVAAAAPEDYACRLTQFLENKGSYLSARI